MRKRFDLHHLIFIGMAIGLVVGLAMAATMDRSSASFKSAVWWLDLFGKDIFIRALKTIIAPLIFASIVSGIGSLPNMKSLGRIGGRTFAYYFVTTSIAVALGLVAVLLIRPGEKAASVRVREAREAVLLEHREAYRASTGRDPMADANVADYRSFVREREGAVLGAGASASQWGRVKRAEERSAGDMFREDILFPILTNPVASLAETNSLGVIAFAIVLGLACMSLGEAARPIMDFFHALNGAMMKITLWLMAASPVALGCIVASLVATLGLDALKSLGWYCATVVVGIAIHVAFLLSLIAILGRSSPIEFAKGIRNAWLIAFSTTSSAATLPVTMQCVTENLKVSKKVANFGLPVGATMNMDGTALYEGVAVVFLIQMYGGLDDVPIVMGGAKTFVIFITAVLASVGAAAVPSAGLVTMAIVAGAVGLPLHYIAIIFAVDHLLDMFRTSTNVLGDMVGAFLVDRWEPSEDADASPEPAPATP